MLVDFHCHTNCSDGELKPLELIELARQKSIKILAITDHDNADAYKQIHPNDYDDIKIITGIEFSTVWNKVGIHIIGLNFDLNSKSIQSVINSHKLFRTQRAKVISKRLEKVGLLCGFDKLVSKQINQIGRPDFAKLLVEESICKDVQQAFKKHLGAGKTGDVKNKWLPYDQIVQSIINAGGIAVLAHPLVYKLTNSKLKRLIEDFKFVGGQAIEVINGYQNSDKTKYLCNLCREFNLLASLGSDFHRHNNWTQLGCHTNIISEVSNICENI